MSIQQTDGHTLDLRGTSALATVGPYALQSIPHAGVSRPPQARLRWRAGHRLYNPDIAQRYDVDTALAYADLDTQAYALEQYGRRGIEIITSWAELADRWGELTGGNPWSTNRLATVRDHLRDSGLVTWRTLGTGAQRLRLTVHRERLGPLQHGLTVPPPEPKASTPPTPAQLDLPIMAEVPPAPTPATPCSGGELAVTDETKFSLGELAFSGLPNDSKVLAHDSAAPVLPQAFLSVVGLLPRAKEVVAPSPSTSALTPETPTASTPSVVSSPVNRGLPTRPDGKTLVKSGHEPTNQPDPLSRQGRHGLQHSKTTAGHVRRGVEDPMHPTEQRPAGRQVIYQAILTGGWRVFLPWASARELEALIASGPQDPSDPLYIPMQLARWIDSNRTKGADFHLGPLWREHFTTRWMAGARSRFGPSIPPPDPEAVAEVQAQRARGAEARARTPELAEAVKAVKDLGAVLMARGRLSPEAWRALRRALDQAEDLATVDALMATLR